MFKKFNSKIEKLFDQSPDHILTAELDASVKDSNFHIVNNNKMLENLSYVFSNEINNETLINLFTQLSAYFEIGLLLEKSLSQNNYQVVNAFAFQKNIKLPEELTPIKLPDVGVFKIVKSNAYNLLSRFGMGYLDSQKKMTSYLIPITPNFSIVVITPLAEPWAQLKIEALQKTLMRINFSI